MFLKNSEINRFKKTLILTEKNIKYNFLKYFILSLIIILITPVIFGTQNLDSRASAIPLEFFIALTGIILITPLFFPENDAGTDELITSKYFENSFVYTIRIIYAVLTLFLLILFFVFYLKLNNCTVNFYHIYGTFSSALFLGSLGLITSALIKNNAVPYMIPLIYFMLNFSGGSKLGKFYIFGMSSGIFEGKIFLLVSGFVLIISAVLIKKYSEK